MPAKNVLFIMSDEHSKRVTGCYGNDIAQTPHMDRLAREGTTFDAAYANCPICVPSRASFQTGRYVHEIGYWDNGFPYHGEPEGWGHALRRQGHRVESMGKLHFRSTEDDNGFGREILPLHVLDGKGDLQGMLRNPPPKRPSTAQLAGDAGRGESTYTRYDREIRDAACAWLEERAARPDAKPWVGFISFVCPHFPLVAPEEFFDLYPLDRVPMPDLTRPEEFPDHPVLKKLREVQNYQDYFEDEERIRTAIAAYYGMVSFLDDNIGRVLATLEKVGLAEDTLVVYTSDHGDNLGTRTFWGKSNMYEESNGIPLIMRGPGVEAGKRVRTPVSLVDSAPTICEAVGGSPEADDLPGRSLFAIAGGADPDRTVFAEYHAVASITGVFMVRWDRWKYVHYEGYRPQLYDLEADPFESRDLALEPGHDAVLAEGERRLRAICDPAEVTARAFADQARRIEEHGGEAKVRALGSYPYTPAPGEAPRISGAG